MVSKQQLRKGSYKRLLSEVSFQYETILNKVMALTCFPALAYKKGLIIMLVWSFIAWVLFSYMYFYITDFHRLLGKDYFRYIIYGSVGLIIPSFPVMGWSADIHWGRYQILRRSLQIMWLASIAFCLLYVIPDSLPHAMTAKYAFDIVILVILLFSLTGIQANILQFGVDQLPDASSADITAFINWYVWVGGVGYIVATFSSNCVCSKYTAVAKLLLPACMTLALCLDYNFNHWLIKEPVSENPLKLIYRVMHYAWKNKYPRQRSAFTYSEDKRYSRIDFAKQKFGGPFTTEKVEDVKTFWRILLSLLTMSLCIGFMVNVHIVATKMEYHLRNFDSTLQSSSSCSAEDISKCFRRYTAYNFGYLAATILIPLYNLPQCHPIRQLSSVTKFNIGLFLALISTIAYLSLEVAGHLKLQTNTTNTTCLLEVNQNNPSTWSSLPLDYKWIMILECLRGASYFFMITAGIQFICAQSPYSMKGLIVGLVYGFLGTSSIIIYILLLPITYTVHKWPPNRYGCGMWYLLSASIVLLIVFILACILSRRYKNRKRDDILPNEQVFAINYYSHYTKF